MSKFKYKEFSRIHIVLIHGNITWMPINDWGCTVRHGMGAIISEILKSRNSF